MDALIQQLIERLKRTGGFAASFNGAELPETGYMVEDFDSLEFHVHILTNTEVVSRALRDFIGERKDILSVPTMYLTAWIDPDMTVSVSLARWMPDRTEALALARTNSLGAVWDLEQEQEIHV